MERTSVSADEGHRNGDPNTLNDNIRNNSSPSQPSGNRTKLSLYIPSKNDQISFSDSPDLGISRSRQWRTSSSPHGGLSRSTPKLNLIKKQSRVKGQQHQNLMKMKSLGRSHAPKTAIPSSGSSAASLASQGLNFQSNEFRLMPKLNNAFVDMCVVVGMDEDTGLKITSKSQISFTREWDSVYSQAFEPQILAVANHQLAYFPQSLNPVEYFLNSKDFILPSEAKTTTPSSGTKQFHFSRQNPYKQSFKRRMSVKSHGLAALPNNEMISNLPPLCFPSDAVVYESEPEEKFQFLYLVLTSITGTRSYATCLTYYRKFSMSQTKEDGSYDLHHPSLPHSRLTCWVPTCICLISTQPYFTAMKTCLSSLIPGQFSRPEAVFKVVKDFMQRLSAVPTPPPGSLCVSFAIHDATVTLHPAESSGKPVVDLPLHLPFLCFSVDSVMDIVACFLSQQSIVFLSQDYALLTPFMEAFLSFILPFKWPFVYVPVVCSSLLDFLEAPGCFLMGCHSSHKVRISQIENLVIVDIQQGTVTKCPSLSIPPLPPMAVKGFKERFYAARSKYYDLTSVRLPVSESLDTEQRLRQRCQRQFQREILDCFLECMAVLFRDMQDFINYEQRRFKADEFLASRRQEELPFYSSMLKLDIFKPFLDDRLNQKRDYYTYMEKKLKPVYQNSLAPTAEQGRLRRPSFTTSYGINRRQSQGEQLITFTLPSLSSPDQNFCALLFFEKCIDLLNTSLERCKSPSNRAPYLYLRGMYHVACSHTLKGLEDFHGLFATDLSILPVELIADLIEDLDPHDKDKLFSIEFTKHKDISRLLDQRSAYGLRQPQTLISEEIPDSGSLNSSEFIKWIQHHEIAIDVAVIERLFKALSAGQGNLDRETFVCFLHAWKEADEEVKAVPAHIYEDHLDNTESVLKLSGVVRSVVGTGRLVMTDKRVFFLKEGYNSYCEVMTIRDIEKMEKFEYFKYLLSVPSLRIYSHKEDVKPFEANLKGERNCWDMLLTELWSGKKIAIAQKDPQIVQQAARNVLLLDAVIRSAENQEAMHSKYVTSSAMQLCHFTKLKEEGMASVAPDTSSELVHKFNPSSNEPQSSTVEAMIYTPGNRSLSEEENSPKLWCAMGSGKVKVFDGSNFGLEAEFDEPKERVCCLLAVNLEQVWAGSFNTKIYVIDTQTFEAKIVLLDHQDIVSDMTLSEDKRLAYTASLNGQIIIWDTETLTKQNQLQLEGTRTLISIKNYDKKLWCCTKKEIRVLSEEGEVLKYLTHPKNEENSTIFFQPILITNKQLWCGCYRRGELVCWDTEEYKLLNILEIPNCTGISKLEAVNNMVWACSKKGQIHLYNSKTMYLEKDLDGHEDVIRSICLAEERYVMTGAGSSDGKVAIWRARFVTSSG